MSPKTKSVLLLIALSAAFGITLGYSATHTKRR